MVFGWAGREARSTEVRYAAEAWMDHKAVAVLAKEAAGQPVTPEYWTSRTTNLDSLFGFGRELELVLVLVLVASPHSIINMYVCMYVWTPELQRTDVRDTYDLVFFSPR